MKASRFVLTGTLAFGSLLGIATAQVAPPRPVPVYRPIPQDRRHVVHPSVHPHVHAYRDWTTGRENLPLAKPWLHRGQ